MRCSMAHPRRTSNAPNFAAFAPASIVIGFALCYIVFAGLHLVMLPARPCRAQRNLLQAADHSDPGRAQIGTDDDRLVDG
jgi:hypothetical protein